MTKFHCGWLVSLKSGVKFKVVVWEVVAWVIAYDIHDCTLELGWSGRGKCLMQYFTQMFMSSKEVYYKHINHTGTTNFTPRKDWVLGHLQWNSVITDSDMEKQWDFITLGMDW